MEDRTPIAEAARVTAVVLAVYAVALGLAEARLALLLGFFAIVVATVLAFPIDWLARRMPRGLAVLVTLGACVAAIIAAAVVVVPIVRGALADLPGQLAGARAEIASLLGDGGATVQHVADQVPKTGPMVAVTAQLLSSVVLTFVLALFLAAGRDALRGGVRRLVPRDDLPVFDSWWQRSGEALRHWVGGIAVSMVIMGTLVGVALSIAGIHGAVFLGLVTFFGTFVPYLGAIASALPGLAVALTQSPRHALIAAAIYLGVHIVEGYIVEPLIMKRAVKMQPALLIFWQVAIGIVFGIPGVIVATPLLAVVQASVEVLWVERRVQAV